MALALARQAVAGPSVLRAAFTLPAVALPSLRLPSLNDILEWGITLAVPKSKISHSRKSMRSAHKGIKNKTNLNHCPACGSVKLSHNLCANCFSQISRRWKKEARAPVGEPRE
ncbi:putative 54S ribosomal protein L32, mitochondrial [Vanrija pseudolonga]|uniref:Large ribosomal subunit protein bL32m n=1 Tax=Vanrija pseudolonga TaxID=143232 RepID=A0AAF0YHE9_9TREE|nr:putative 54S ribosomal protein L32, mitochondrial [Vanrija pseudolonga]